MNRSCSLNELSLFTGTGGGLLGTHLLGFRPVCAVEKEPYAREVLLQRQRDGMLPLFPIWDEAETFDGKPWRGVVDIVTGGFPCQSFSVSGKRLGEDDERNMWPDTIRIIREVGPEFVFLENSPNLLSFRYFGTILGEIYEAGFDAEWRVIGADYIGAPHERERLWILAHSTGRRRKMERHTEKRNATPEIRKAIKSSRPNNIEEHYEITWWDEDPADISDTTRIQPGREEQRPERERIGKSREQNGTTKVSNIEGKQMGTSGQSRKSSRKSERHGPFESGLVRVAHGVAHRVDRLKALGNGQVPGVVREAWNILYGRIMNA